MVNSASDCTSGTTRHREDGVDAENKRKKKSEKDHMALTVPKQACGVPQHTDKTLHQQQREEGRELELRDTVTK